MSNPVVHRRATGDIVTEIVNRVTALTWQPPTPPGGPVPAPVPAFNRVEVFDSENLVEAFRFLIVTEQRVAVVVPLDEEFKPAIHGMKLVMTRRLPVVVLVSDRVLGDRKSALLGSQDLDIATPGALALAELVLPAVTGMLLGPEDKVVIKPLHSGPFFIRDQKRELDGTRLCVALETECTGGKIEVLVGLAPEF